MSSHKSETAQSNKWGGVYGGKFLEKASPEFTVKKTRGYGR